MNDAAHPDGLHLFRGAAPWSGDSSLTRSTWALPWIGSRLSPWYIDDGYSEGAGCRGTASSRGTGQTGRYIVAGAMIDDGRQGDGPAGSGGGARDVPDAPAPDKLDAPRLQADSAQLLEMNRRLRDAAQRRDDLLSTAAEDLRGPAAALLMDIRRLKRRDAGLSDGERRALAALDRHARQVAALADGLAELKTIERGQVLLRPRPIELGALVGEIVEARRAQARERGIDVAHELPPYPVTVPADPDRVVELVGRLLDAALGATGRGGRVRIAVEALPDGARVVVEDGRAAGSRVGRPPPRAQRMASSGLAHAVCRGLAELHGGSLQVEARGGGRVALLTLPAAAPAVAGDEVREPARAPASAGRARLLVVDDDPDAREALAMILGDDYDVVLAADGREAIDAALVARPDVVLMDLYMPRMDGLAALEAMRADPVTEDVPVILISARGDELTRSRSLDLGAVDFLTKPFSGRELKARLDRTLRLTRRETQLQELARTDPLTGLANLRAFRAPRDRLRGALRRRRVRHAPPAHQRRGRARLRRARLHAPARVVDRGARAPAAAGGVVRHRVARRRSRRRPGPDAGAPRRLGPLRGEARGARPGGRPPVRGRGRRERGVMRDAAAAHGLAVAPTSSPSCSSSASSPARSRASAAYRLSLL